MNHEERLKQIFADALGIDRSLVRDELEYNSIPEWDSVSHMALVAAIDSAFGILMETDEVINLSSFGRAKEILSRYGIQFIDS